MLPRPRLSTAAALVALALTAAAACADLAGTAPAPAGSACSCDSLGARVVDPVLLAFLSKARAAHHQADVAQAAAQPEKAIEALERFVSGPRPGGAPAPEVAEVLADARARLADLRSARGDFDLAARDVDEGLALAEDVTHFRGHLLEARGVVEERRAKALEDRGDVAGARAARERAVLAFQQAIDVQDQVIARSLRDGGAP